ncbi:MAG: aminoacyl-tRNA hydrolase [Pseudomonadota bacterium]
MSSASTLISKILRQRGYGTKQSTESSASLSPLFIVGLGNPGSDYVRTRHNIGFMAVDALHDAWGFPAYRAKYDGMMSEGTVDGQKIVLLKPMTFMNESGRSVGPAMRFYKSIPGRLVAIHDELDLPTGAVRCKLGGGNAGHNGLKSIQAHLGTPDFWRMRMGIDHPGSRERVTGHVLGAFTAAEREVVDIAIKRLVEQRAALATLDMKTLEQVTG